MDWKSFFYGVLTVFILFLAMSSFGLAHMGKINSLNADIVSGSAQAGFNDIPEKCRLPAGQDLSSWKEHLGHHAETKDCLDYF